MDQRITIKIAGQDYTLKAATPEHEELIRKAAETINAKIAAYTSKFPSRAMTDIMSFVALNESISNLALQKKLDGINAEVKSLTEATESYLKNNM